MDSAELKIEADEYRKSRTSYDNLVDELVSLSVAAGGSPSGNKREYWSSVLVTKMALTSMTLNNIIPNIASVQSTELWDLSSVATLVRALIENYLLLFWLCVETDDDELWDFRITCLVIADNRSRYRMITEIEGEPEPDDFVAAQRNLSKELANNKIFQQLNERERVELLRGTKAPFIQDDVISRLDLDRNEFRSVYRYLSSFVHTGTISFFRMDKHQRGNGEFNDYEAVAINGCMNLAKLVIQAAISDMKRIHPWTAAAGVSE